MDYVKVDGGGGINGVEMVVLAVLLLVVAVAAWQLYLRFSGRNHSDVERLHLTNRRPHV